MAYVEGQDLPLLATEAQARDALAGAMAAAAAQQRDTARFIVEHGAQVLGGHSDVERVLSRYAMRSQQEVAEEQAIRRRSAELREKAEDEAVLVQLGLAPPPRSTSEVLAAYAVSADEQDRKDERERASRADARANQALAMVAQLEAQLANERRSHDATSRSLSTANQLYGSARSEQRYERPRQFYRSGGSIVGLY